MTRVYTFSASRADLHRSVTREAARIVRQVQSLGRPGRPSFDHDLLSRRYGRELARCARVLLALDRGGRP